ncbi:unnamed protein product, partial [Prorocentrum cordatum]
RSAAAGGRRGAERRGGGRWPATEKRPVVRRSPAGQVRGRHERPAAATLGALRRRRRLRPPDARE